MFSKTSFAATVVLAIFSASSTAAPSGSGISTSAPRHLAVRALDGIHRRGFDHEGDAEMTEADTGDRVTTVTTDTVPLDVEMVDPHENIGHEGEEGPNGNVVMQDGTPEVGHTDNTHVGTAPANEADHVADPPVAEFADLLQEHFDIVRGHHEGLVDTAWEEGEKDEAEEGIMQGLDALKASLMDPESGKFLPNELALKNKVTVIMENVRKAMANPATKTEAENKLAAARVLFEGVVNRAHLVV